MLILVPHAHKLYSGICMKAGYDQIILKNYNHIIFISTLHKEDPYVIVDNINNKIFGLINNLNNYDNYKKIIKYKPQLINKEHSLIFNLPFIKKYKLPFSIFFINNYIKKNILTKFILLLNKWHTKKTLYIFNSDFSHLGPRFNNPIKPDERNNSIEQLLDKKEMYFIKKLVNLENVDNIPNIGCGNKVMSIIPHLKFLKRGKLICSYHSLKQDNTKYNKYSNIVSYRTIIFPFKNNKIFGGINSYEDNYLKKLKKYISNFKFFPKNLNVSNNIVFLTIYNKKNVIGCMGSRKGKLLIEKILGALESIYNFDSRFIETKTKKINPTKFIYKISNIQSNKKKQFKLEKWKEQIFNNKGKYSMKIEDLKSNKSAFYVPSVAFSFNNVDDLYKSLYKKAGEPLNPKYFLIPTDKWESK